MKATEAQIQGAIVEWLRYSGYLTFHIPNGGLRGKREAAKLKWQGVLAGVPDLAVIWQELGEARLCFIEVKTASGRLSEDQSDFRNKVNAIGFDYIIARSLDDVMQWFEGMR